MIIPDDHNEQPIEPRKSTRGSVVEVANNYQLKVNAMLTKMIVGQTIRIARVCKPETQPKFIQAIKNFIDDNPWGGGIDFTNDFKTFRRTETPDEWTGSRSATITPINREAVARRNSLIRWFRTYQKTTTIPKFTIQATTYNEPKRFIENMIATLKQSKHGSSPFRAAVNHLETIKNHLTT